MIFIAEGFQVICHLSTSDMSPIRKGSLHGRINHGFVEGRGKLADCCYQADAKGPKRPHLCLCHPRGSSYCGRVGDEQRGMSSDQRDDHRSAKWPSVCVYLHP
ncbi:hypothetical protein CDAR_540941 [Caerostris darwini]|uniref:Uncharacterized protein n=1 Tax=Caerostris darwini TaxID=1538125 RepID=A0AAV4VJF5_9ARAC|nr:hypothetical protein CDAR_540941 [Caerostris darwini]